MSTALGALRPINAVQLLPGLDVPKRSTDTLPHLYLGTVSTKHSWLRTPHRANGMADDPVDNEGNEPSPLLLIAVGVVPLLGVLGWYFGLLG